MIFLRIDSSGGFATKDDALKNTRRLERIGILVIDFETPRSVMRWIAGQNHRE